jgi:Copper type II ascorbate-dependent monooxygenase, C-terminal domain
MIRFVVVAALSWIALAGCGAEGTGDDDPGDEPDDILIGNYALQWGPVSVPPSREATQCIWLRLSNETEIKVHKMHNQLSSTSHHLIVYRDDMDTTEQLTPVPCQPFTGALNATGKIFPVMITQKDDDELTLPPHVAYTLAPHQMIKIEMHYLNAGDSAAPATAMVNFFAADPAAIRDEANILFIGTPDIALKGNSASEVHGFFTPERAGLDLTDAKFFAITGHTHKLGLSVDVGVGDTSAGPFAPVYAPTDFSWSEPVTAAHKPEFRIPDGGGFDFTCKYYNNTSATVGFGESASNEMCFFWAYYYPSNGSHVCVHTVLRNVGLDLCCPEAGPQLCDLITSGGLP